MTTYPISKIRSGEVAVKIENYEQYKKICEAVGDHWDDEESYSNEYKYYGISEYGLFSGLSQKYLLTHTLIDFTQIDWEEGKEVDIVEKVIDIISQFGDGETKFHTSDIEYLVNQLSTLKAENERLNKENERLVKFNNELSNLIHKQILDNIKLNHSQNQELSLKQRMAWELWKEDQEVSIETCFFYADKFLNYKGGDDEKV